MVGPKRNEDFVSLFNKLREDDCFSAVTNRGWGFAYGLLPSWPRSLGTLLDAQGP